MKNLMFLCLGCLLILGTSQGAGSKSDRLQVVYREQPNGQWQVSVYGTVCEDLMRMRLVEPDAPVTRPFIVECYHPQKGEK